MSAVWQILATVLWLYWLTFIARLILDLVQAFSRSWRPTGFILIITEFVFTITDPPLKFLRRFIKPIRLGNFSFDLAFLIVLVALNILIGVVQGLGRG
jgi:YggT family protein